MNLDWLHGSFVPLVVPFDEGRVDYGAFSKICEWQIEKGSHGLLVNATSGEPTTLTLEERARLVEVAKDVSAGRVPICAGTASQSHAETVELVGRYERLDVDAIVVVTPYYCKPPQRALVEFFSDVGRRTSKPILIYHIPGRAAVSLTLDTILEIKDRVDNLAGLKNTDTDIVLVNRVLSQIQEFRIFCGTEFMSLPMLAVGGCGIMISLSNVVPDKIALLYDYHKGGKVDMTHSLNNELEELFYAVGFDTPPITTKYMVKRIGVISKNEHRLPLVTTTPELEKRLDAVLSRAGLI
ncbi:MAG: 4-hydroxy-tetrahydrodipicolinate synthase [Devosia sp.]